MRKTILLLLLLLISLLVNQACKKKDPSPDAPQVDVPDPYTYSSDLQSSKDIVAANRIISDIEMMCSLIGENVVPKFYLPAASSAGTLNTISDPAAKYHSLSFNNTQCVDGSLRNGSIFMNYSYSPANVKNYHDIGFVAKVYLVNYEIDGWLVQNNDTGANAASIPLIMTNITSPANYNPANTNLTWQITGKLKFINPSDTTRNMTWDGNFTKTLVNSSNALVFNPNKLAPIQWPAAIVSYVGNASGFTSNNSPFTFNIANAPVKRDFNCNFIPPGSTGITELHPFISGTMVFNPANFHPRSINFGPGDPGLCDNKGTVSFKNETHNVDFN